MRVPKSRFIIYKVQRTKYNFSNILDVIYFSFAIYNLYLSTRFFPLYHGPIVQRYRQHFQIRKVQVFYWEPRSVRLPIKNLVLSQRKALYFVHIFCS